ncbi:MAG: MATE family efflux transporter [Lachnospiraceae bacterium]
MTKGNPASLIFSFAISMTAGNIFQQLYTVVDTMIVGKKLGVTALAAIGASDWINWMMLGMIQGLTQGFGIMMAQQFGANQLKALRKSIGNAALLSLASSLFLVLIGQTGILPLLHILQTPETIIDRTLLYTRIMFMGIPIVMLYNFLACILRSLGDAKTPLYAMIIASICNIILDSLFVLVFEWGIVGAAIATLIAQLISSIFCIYHIRKIEILKFERDDFLLEKNLSGHLLYLGFPMAFQNGIIAIGGMIVQSVVNKFGVIFIAGFTATNKLYGLLEIAAISYGYSVVTYMGQNLGARKIKRIKEGMRSALIIAVLTSVVITIIMLIFGKFILGLFISGTPETVEKTMKIAYLYLSIMSICLPILYILHVVRSAIQGLGNTILPMVSGFVEFGMRTLAAILLPLFIGQIGIFFAEISAWTGADIVLIISYFIVTSKLPKESSKDA